MGIYKIHYEIKTAMPDMTATSDGGRAVIHSEFNEMEVQLDGGIEKRIRVVGIEIIAISILAGLTPLWINYASRSFQDVLPFYIIIPLSTVCGLCQWMMFSWLFNTFYVRPWLKNMLPSDIKEKGLIEIIRFSKKR